MMTVAPTTAQPGREQHRSRWGLAAIVSILLGGLVVALLYQLDVLGSSSNPLTVGSGIPATQPRDVAAFHSVELAGGNNVVIHVGGHRSVVVRADDNLLASVTTDVHSGKLVIASRPGSLTAKTPMRVEIRVPALDALRLAGSGNIVVDGIRAESLEVTLPGSGTLTGSGAATRLDVTLGGSGTVHFTSLVARDVRAVVSGSGSIFITATRSLDASVPGSGAILYAGEPKDVTKIVSGSGAITATR